MPLRWLDSSTIIFIFPSNLPQTTRFHILNTLPSHLRALCAREGAWACANSKGSFGFAIGSFSFSLNAQDMNHYRYVMLFLYISQRKSVNIYLPRIMLRQINDDYDSFGEIGDRET